MRRERREIGGWEDERAGTFLEEMGRIMLFPIPPMVEKSQRNMVDEDKAGTC